jgi:FtsP/CotA-like multicopper oxidase with cupredoxin domain
VKNKFKLSRVAASVAVAITGIAASQAAFAGSGFADITTAAGAQGRIQTYFVYSPSGLRDTEVPEGKAVGVQTIDPVTGFTINGLGLAPTDLTTGRQTTGKALRKFIDPLPLPGAANAKKMADGVTDKYIPVAVASKWVKPDGLASTDDYYEIGLVEYTDKFHSDLKKATVLRGYVQIDHQASNGRTPLTGSKSYPLMYPDGVTPIKIAGTDANGKLNGTQVNALAVDAPHFLGPVIVATKDVPTRLKFLNLLPTGRAEVTGSLGSYVVSKRNGDLFLPVDKSILGAGIGPDGVTEYTQNRADVHLHGGDTPWISDGTPHQWITPAGEADPANPLSLAAAFGAGGDTTYLPNYLRGASAANVPDMNDPGDGAVTYYFPNGQSARFLWYHDHTFGATRLNVYAGMASGYLLTDATEQAMVGSVLPPASRTIPLVMQDRTFVPDDIALQDANWNTTAWGAPGDSWFPHVYETVQDPAQQNNWNAVGRWHYGPWFWPVFPSLYPLPTGEYSPAGGENTVTTTPEGWHDTPVINGVAYPVLEVDPAAYRFRMLNATNDRMLTFNLFKAQTKATLMDGTLVTSPLGATEVNMVPAAAPLAANACAPSVLRGVDPLTGAVCTPDTWPTDGRIGGVPSPADQGPPIHQFASEGGWLPNVVTREPTPINYLQDKGRITVLNVELDRSGLFLGPAERADVVIDFSAYPGQEFIVYNDSGAPVPAGDPRNDLFTGVGDQSGSGGAEDTKPGYGPNTRTMMKIKVRAAMADGSATPGAFNVPALNTAVQTAFSSTQARPVVAQAAYAAAFDPTGSAGWAALTPKQQFADIYTGSLKNPTFQFTPGTPLAGINSVQVTNGGSGYITAPLVTISAPAALGGAAATAVATMKIDKLTMTNNGSGYTSAPTVAFANGGGNGVLANATLVINKVNLTSGGSYTTVPTVKFTAPPAGGTAPVATVQTTTTAGKIVVTGVTITTPGTGYTAAPLVTFVGTGTAAKATTSGGVGALVMYGTDNTSPATQLATQGGGGYTDLSQLTITFAGGGGTGAAASATGKVFDITLTHPGVGYVAADAATVTVTVGAPASGVQATAQTDLANNGAAKGSILVKTKTIQELFDPTYGRLNATLGVELPFTSAFTQTTIPLGYVDEATEDFADGETQIWKITHNGVDSHPVHFHLLNVQVINRVGWDGFITPPEPNELGWKETIKMSPLEDIIVAVKANKPKLPGFGLPLSNRLMDPTQPEGSPFGFTQIDPTTGNPKTVVNAMANFGWEYVWHCHILGHEENDFMRPVVFHANETIPSAPTGNAAAGVTNGVTVTWTDTSSTEFLFDILRADVQIDGTNGPFASVGKALANAGSFFDATATGSANASGGTSYAYKVVAVGAAGSAESGIAVTPMVDGVPSGPTNLVAQAQSGTQVALSWTDTSLNETGFTLTRTVGTTTTTITLPGNTVSYLDNGLTANTLVSYTLVSTNGAGPSTTVASTSVLTLGAPALSSLSATANSPTQITLAWTTAPAAVNQKVTSYAIARTGGAGAANFTVLGTATGYTDNSALQNTTYTYTVNAVNGTGVTPVNGAASSVTVQTPLAAPTAITSATATAAGPSPAVTVNWAGGTPSDSANIARCTATVANFDCTLTTSVWLPSVSTALKPYVDNTTVASTSYVYRVTAVNGTGLPNAASSNTVTTNLVTTPGGVSVTAPTGLTAAVSFATSRVTLTWTDASANETAFVIERSIDGVNFSQVGTAASRAGTGLTRTFSDAAVSAGQTYYYRVIAQRVVGASVSESVPSTVVKVDYFLVAPSGLTATLARTNRITLNWTDNSTAEASFAVWRSAGTAAATQVGTVTRTAAQVAGTGAVTFNDNTAFVLGTTYTYYVTAVNGTVASGASNTSIVPFVAPAAPANFAAAVNPVGSRTVVLTWSAVPGATSYNVTRTAPGGTVNVATNTTALTATQLNVVRNATVPYTYSVRANGIAGNSPVTTTTVLVP